MNVRSLGRALSRLVCILAAALVLATSSLAAASSEQGRWKLGSQGCYWDENDSGPDQCSPDSGRWKLDGLQCYWAADDSGPNQCDPANPPQFTEAQLDGLVADANTIAAMGAPIDEDLPTMGDMEYRVRSNIPFTQMPPIALDFVWVIEQVWVQGYGVPPRGYEFPVLQTMPGYGQIPVIVRPPAPPRRMTCSEKAERLEKMQKLALALGVGTLAYSGAAVELRNFPRLTHHQQRFARASWFYGVLGATVQAWVLLVRDAPCDPDEA